MTGHQKGYHRIVFWHHFNPDHTLSYPTSGFLIHHHNMIRDFLATLITQVCYDMVTELVL